jgi:hypothetical protein
VGRQRPDRKGEWLGLVPHVRALLTARGRLPGPGERELARCAAQVVVALQFAGSYPAALDVADAATARDSGLAGDDPAVLQLRFRRAVTMLLLGRPAEAEAEFGQVLDARLRVQGPDHPHTLTTRHFVAYMLAYRAGTRTPRPSSGRSSTPGCGSSGVAPL